MSEMKNAPVEVPVSNKGQGVGELTRYDSILSDLFGQVCVLICKLNERKSADGYGCYDFTLIDACISVFYTDHIDMHYIFHMYRSEINSVGLDTALRNLIEILKGELE